MQCVTLRVTQRLFFVRWIGVRLRSPFRPSASYFDGAKVTKPPGSASGPTSSGSFVLTLIRGVAATGHPWPGASSLASCQATPGSAPGLSRHLRRNLRRQRHRDRKALLWQRLTASHAVAPHLRGVTQSVTNCIPTRSVGTIVKTISCLTACAENSAPPCYLRCGFPRPVRSSY